MYLFGLIKLRQLIVHVTSESFQGICSLTNKGSPISPGAYWRSNSWSSSYLGDWFLFLMKINIQGKWRKERKKCPFSGMGPICNEAKNQRVRWSTCNRFTWQNQTCASAWGRSYCLKVHILQYLCLFSTTFIPITCSHDLDLISCLWKGHRY